MSGVIRIVIDKRCRSSVRSSPGRFARSVVREHRSPLGRCHASVDAPSTGRRRATRTRPPARRWAAHNVRPHHTGSKGFRHPVVGDLTVGLRGLVQPSSRASQGAAGSQPMRGCTWWVSGQRDGGVSVPERLADTLRRAARRRAAARPGVASVVPPDHRRLLSSSALRACAVWAPERAEPLRPPRAPSIPLQQGRCPDGVDQVWSTLRYRPGLGRLPLAAGDRRAAQPCTAHVTDSASRSVNGIPPCA
jgi:MmyB-like transcription regulator ligand binding domain